MLSVLRKGIQFNSSLRSPSRALTTSTFSNLIDIHPKVRKALSEHKPVVALESTIITHGMPRPCNLETALEVESIVAKEGSTPATIAIIDGRIKVGLTGEQLKRLANLGAENAIKCSRRDLAYVLCKKLCGGTTVSGTLIIANMVGIKVFATGGIGGVHRDGHITMDVSADLTELGRTPAAVVSSGIKSILDIPRTLEYLETQGVCIATYKNSSLNFPAFYTRSSGVKAPYNLNNSREAAELINSSLELNLQSGILIGVPIPEEHAVSEQIIDDAINNSLKLAQEKGIHGKEVTPFVLEAVSQITEGKSLSSNMALIKNNAMVASQIAVELSILQTNSKQNNVLKSKESSEHTPVVVGASILDMCLRVNEPDLKLDGATYTVECKSFGGGVGRNIAEGLSKLYGDIHFISAVGNDEIGNNLKSHLPSGCQNGIHTDPKHPTSMCTVVFDKFGDSKLVLGDMKIHQSITPELIIANEDTIAKCPLVVMDSNVPIETMAIVLDICKKYNRPVFFEPTDMRIASKPFQLSRDLTQSIKFTSPNVFEFKEIAAAINKTKNNQDEQIDLNKSKGEIFKSVKVLLNEIKENFDCIILTLGEHGVIIASRANSDQHFFKNFIYIPQNGSWKYRFYGAPKVNSLVNVSGAGDSFTSGFISGMLNGRTESECVNFGFHAATCALKSEGAVPTKYFKTKEDKVTYLQTKALYETV